MVFSHAANCTPEIIPCMENSCIDREKIANQRFVGNFYDKNYACSQGNYDRKQCFNSLDNIYTNTKAVPDHYPSAYRQNVLVMLAKRLMDEGYGDVSKGLVETRSDNYEETPLEIDTVKVSMLLPS